MKIRSDAFTQAGRTFSGAERGIIEPASGEVEIPDQTMAVAQLCYPTRRVTGWGSTIPERMTACFSLRVVRAGGGGDQNNILFTFVRGIWQITPTFSAQQNTAGATVTQPDSGQIILADPGVTPLGWILIQLPILDLNEDFVITSSTYLFHIPEDGWELRMLSRDPITGSCTTQCSGLACRLL